MAYSLETALAIDRLLQQGIPLDTAFAQLNIPQDDRVYYNLSPEGTFVVPPPVLVGDTDDAEQGAFQQAAILAAQQQSSIQQSYGQSASNTDWRVRLRLAPQASYLYKDASNTILRPLLVSDGVIFPYLPTITNNYQAKYDTRDLTHSNYRGYFYRNSSVEQLQITGTFTAQDTEEARYLLAVMHFFRSATKMFYGQDTERGAPPPLVFLSGLGTYQYNNHPCVISNFSYTLPNTVDYIRTESPVEGQQLNTSLARVSTSPASTITWPSISGRISSLIDLVTGNKVPPGAQPGQTSNDVTGLGITAPALSSVSNAQSETTYVPTKIELAVSLLPIQTRAQVSQEFSLKEFANGNLLRRGFW